MRHFSLRLKQPNWDRIFVGVGDELTDRKIARYAREGRYGARIGELARRSAKKRKPQPKTTLINRLLAKYG